MKFPKVIRHRKAEATIYAKIIPFIRSLTRQTASVNR